MKKCAYEVLGVDQSADAKAIKSAYRKLMVVNHPDKVKDPAKKEQAQIKAQQIKEAYEVLHDDNSRRKYDGGGWAAIEADKKKSSGGPTPERKKYSANDARKAVRGTKRVATHDELRVLGKSKGTGSIFERFAKKNGGAGEENNTQDVEETFEPDPLVYKWVLMDTMMKETVVEALRDSGNDDLADLLENAESRDAQNNAKPDGPKAA